ncbi:MAG: hypothetical protein H6854_03000 [Rhodospirillales bacterium]|nr:hypothetical protein [Rhodospirillales bacterium]
MDGSLPRSRGDSEKFFTKKILQNRFFVVCKSMVDFVRFKEFCFSPAPGARFPSSGRSPHFLQWLAADARKAFSDSRGFVKSIPFGDEDLDGVKATADVMSSVIAGSISGDLSEEQFETVRDGLKAVALIEFYYRQKVQAMSSLSGSWTGANSYGRECQVHKEILEFLRKSAWYLRDEDPEFSKGLTTPSPGPAF